MYGTSSIAQLLHQTILFSSHSIFIQFQTTSLPIVVRSQPRSGASSFHSGPSPITSSIHRSTLALHSPQTADLGRVPLKMRHAMLNVFVQGQPSDAFVENGTLSKSLHYVTSVLQFLGKTHWFRLLRHCCGVLVPPKLSAPAFLSEH
jgi:hypothetical protein